MSRLLKLLFICGQNRMRSPTAEHIMQDVPGYVVKSAGIDPSSKIPVKEGHIRWADIILVMEMWQRLILEKDFPRAIRGKRIICLDIPDEYQYMEPKLVHSLKATLAQHLELPDSF